MIDVAHTPITLAAWLHDLSPFAIRFSPTFGLRWYGLSYVCGFIVGWWLLRRLSSKGSTPLSAQRIADAMILLMMGVVIGGRLGYVLIYDQSLLWSFSNSFPWWGVLRLNEGGMASHGGMVGLCVSTWLIARGPKDASGNRAERVPWLHVMDLVALAATPGLFFGRIANFVNGELLGKVVAKPGEPAPWWAVRFPQERLDWWLVEGPPDQPHGHAAPLTPEQNQQLDSLLSRHALPSDNALSAYERTLDGLANGPAKASAEIARDLEPLISARHPSQIYQAVAEGVIIGIVLWFIWRSPRRPGVVLAWFLILYGVLRVVTEFWRLPDSHLLVARYLGLSRGQWLSALMVLIGAALLMFVLKRSSPVIGGWGVKPAGGRAA